MMATPLKCRWCGRMFVEHCVASEWRYSCDRCKGRESSTGIVSPPDQRRYEGYLRSKGLATA